MLVLTRTIGEAIVIAGKIHVVVLEVSSGLVRLGVQAPRDIIVDREEIHRQRNDLSSSPELLNQQEQEAQDHKSRIIRLDIAP